MVGGKTGVWVAVLVVALALAAARVVGIAAGPPLLEIVSPFRYTLQYDVRYVGDACESFVGKISARDTAALVDRGKCSFVQKAIHVQQSGALAMVVVNDSNESFIMTDDGTRRQLALHAFLISAADGARIKAHLPCVGSEAGSSGSLPSGSAGSAGAAGGECGSGKGVRVAWGFAFPGTSPIVL
ncbi:hypothetical protein T484DRAFT_1878530 [Baffinella frigidus]|nr:hypothetical protein T484DRAFT_1878530 [Cryptophyta sp. CCMP2293]